jgi:biopolymer transport protein ExbD
MKLARRRATRSEIFTGSMADVSFLLIIFFMVTTVFSVTMGMNLALGEPPGPEDEVDPDESVDVLVQADGSLVVDGRSMGLAELVPYVGSRLTVDPLKPVILRTHRDAPYAAMMAILDELRQAPEKGGFEIRNLAIPTFREMEAYWPQGTTP